MEKLKITLNADEAARFLEIKKKLNYAENATIVKTLVVQFVRAYRKRVNDTDTEKETTPTYGDDYNPEELDSIKTDRQVGASTPIGKTKKVKHESSPLQIKINLTDKEVITLDQIIRESRSSTPQYGFRSKYNLVKNIVQSFLSIHEGANISEPQKSILTIRKKWRKSENAKKLS